jgi:hypothetical protein
MDYMMKACEKPFLAWKAKNHGTGPHEGDGVDRPYFYEDGRPDANAAPGHVITVAEREKLKSDVKANRQRLLAKGEADFKKLVSDVYREESRISNYRRLSKRGSFLFFLLFSIFSYHLFPFLWFSLASSRGAKQSSFSLFLLFFDDFFVLRLVEELGPDLSLEGLIDTQREIDDEHRENNGKYRLIVYL